MKITKRIVKYIIFAVVISCVLTICGFKAAYAERGYSAIGGEISIPFLVVYALCGIYNRKEIFKLCFPFISKK